MAHETVGFSSISAFPSMNVASTVLMTMLARGVSRRIHVASLAFLAIIVAGSVVLFWQYLLDAVAGIVIALLSWLLASRIIDARRRRQPRNNSSRPGPAKPWNRPSTGPVGSASGVAKKSHGIGDQHGGKTEDTDR